MTATIIPIRPLPPARPTCAELGVCQSMATPCDQCQDAIEATTVFGALDAGGPAQPADPTPTPFDEIGYWLFVATLGAGSAAIMAVIVGYFYAKWYL